LLQDAFSMAICALFVRTLRLPSLRLAALFLGLMFLYDIFMVFVSPLLFHQSVMMTVATAGEPTVNVAHDTGKCVRTEGETMPMLMLVPRLAPLVGTLDRVFSPPPPPPPPPPPGIPDPHSFWYRLSGAPGAFAMIGLGDIVLPALAIAYGRRVDLCQLINTPARRHGTRGCAAFGRWGGYYAWGVGGYGLGLAVTLAANAYGWTFNGVQGQPALLYLVPGVLGAMWLRALLRRDAPSLWTGAALPTAPEEDCRSELFTYQQSASYSPSSSVASQAR